MKKHLFSTLLIVGVATVGYAQNASHISGSNASDATQIRMKPTVNSSTGSVDAATKFSDSNANGLKQNRFVLTNEEADAAILKVEQQMAQNEGTEGFVKEDYLRKIAVLNKRRPTTTTPQ